MEMRGRCLVDHEIRNLIDSGVISGGGISGSQIQPASFEPTITDECYLLDAEFDGLFRPKANSTVHRTLLELPRRQRTRVDISGGFEAKIGFTYLFPLEQRVRSGPFRFLKSSPKSSNGRTFPQTRLMGDNNTSFDELTNFGDREMMLWLLYQPLTFNAVVHPGLSFNQLRFFSGLDAMLTPSEVLAAWKENPFLYDKDAFGRADLPSAPSIGENLLLYADARGSASHGIAALRARKNPSPIDLSQKAEFPAEEYFEPIEADKSRIPIDPGEAYLLVANNLLCISPSFSAELRSYSGQGLNAQLHRAGFVDPGFGYPMGEGDSIGADLVFELTSHEPNRVFIEHGMPLGELAVFRNLAPKEVYGGAKLGSNYQGQIGIRVPKYFRGFDFASAAKYHERLDREVLCDERLPYIAAHRDVEFRSVGGAGDLGSLLRRVDGGFFHSRYDCETDLEVLQLVPYVLLFDEHGRVFSYQRVNQGQDISRKGDTRLHGKQSIGIGGHILREDAPNYLDTATFRQITKDVRVHGDLSRPVFLGTLYSEREAVDSFHFGFVYGVRVNGAVSPKDSAISSGQMTPIGSFQDSVSPSNYETWSKILIPHLSGMYDKVSQNAS